MDTLKIHKTIKILNALDVLGLCVLLIIAFVFEWVFKELPCPLCMLQRIGILGIAFGFLLNVNFKIRPVHYTISLMSAILTATISTRQIFLHIFPEDAGFGSTVFGLHLYTWTFITCVLVIIYTAIIFSISPQYTVAAKNVFKSKFLQGLKHLAFALIFILTILNGVSYYIQCRANRCDSTPAKYEIQLVAVHPIHT